MAVNDAGQRLFPCAVFRGIVAAFQEVSSFVDKLQQAEDQQKQKGRPGDLGSSTCEIDPYFSSA